MRILTIFLIPASLLLWLASACEPVAIDGDLPDGSSKLCINSYFKADNTFIVNITRGDYVLDDTYDFPGIENATLTLLEDDNLLAHLTPTNRPYRTEISTPGWYTSEVATAKAGKTYKVIINAPGFNTITAESYIPAPVELYSVHVTSTVPDKNYMVPVEISFYDPGDTENFYEIALRRTSIITQADGSKTNSSFEMLVYTEDPAYCNNIESYNDFLKPNEPLMVLFNDVGLNGKLVKVPAMFMDSPGLTPDPSFTYEMHYEIVLYSLSKDYYLYKTSKALQHKIRSDPFAQPAPIYSNVKDGFGIFAGMTAKSIELNYKP